MMPASVPTVVFEGFRHYPIVVLYVLIAATVFVFSDKQPQVQVAAVRNLFLPAWHFVVFTAMTLARIVAEGGFRDYLLVQSIALYALAMIMLYPRYRKG